MRLKHCTTLSKLLVVGVLGLLLSGCDMALLNPKGQIGMEQRSLIVTALLLMLIVVIPAILMTFLFAWKYRESNKSAKYTPNWAHSNKIELVVWGIPCVIILILGALTPKAPTHSTQERLSSAKRKPSPLKPCRWTGSGYLFTQNWALRP